MKTIKVKIIYGNGSGGLYAGPYIDDVGFIPASKDFWSMARKMARNFILEYQQDGWYSNVHGICCVMDGRVVAYNVPSHIMDVFF